MAARVVLEAEINHLSSIQCLKKLHWLPVELRIQFKILVLVFKALHNSSPDYVKSMLIESKPQRVLRSNNIYKKLKFHQLSKKHSQAGLSVLRVQFGGMKSQIISKCLKLRIFLNLN